MHKFVLDMFASKIKTQAIDRPKFNFVFNR